MQHFRRWNQSLRWRLMVSLTIAVLMIWILLAPWLVYRVSEQMQHSLDDRLAASARMAASLVLNNPDIRLSSSAFDVIESAQVDLPEALACRISLVGGDTLAVSADAPSILLQDHAEGFSTPKFGEEAWRIYTLKDQGLQISTAERLSKRNTLLQGVLIAAIAPAIIALIATLLMLYGIITHGFRPLARLSQQVAQREASNLSALSTESVPNEVKSLVKEINLLLGRMYQTVERERRFTGDAAHELRTPLSAIKTQIQIARMTSIEGCTVALEKAELAVARLQNTLNQLLLLARVEGDSDFAPLEEWSAEDITRQAIQDVQSAIDKKQIILSLTSQGGGYPKLPGELAVTALRNLIQNAVQFSVKGADLKVNYSADAHQVCWTIIDHGPGLPEALLPTITHRFVHAGKTSQSGLGLAIVDAVCKRFEGQLVFENGKQAGLKVSLCFPLKIL